MNGPANILGHQRYVVAFVVLVFLASILTFVPGDADYWLQYWWMFPIAFAIALTVNTVGISGAALFVPFFILIFPLIAGAPLQAADTVRLGLVTESFGLSSSALAFLAFGLIDLSIAGVAVLSALPFVIMGAFFTSLVPQAILYVVIAILLLVAVFLIRFKENLTHKRMSEHVAEHVVYDSDNPSARRIERVSRDGKQYSYCITPAGNRRRMIGYGAGGFFQGAAGFGIGELGIISMMLTRIPTRIAIGTSHVIVAATAVAASVLHFLLAAGLPAGYLFPWNIPLMTVPAVVLGGQLAPYVAARLPSRSLERFVSVLFIVIAFALVVLAFKQ